MTIHSGTLAVRIEFPNHAAADPQYVANLQALIKSSMEAGPGVEGLDVNSTPTTPAATGVPKPGDMLIYIRDRKIGKGAYGEVYRVIRARDGQVCAGKTFHPPANRNKRKLDEVGATWLREIRREYALMESHPHVSFVSFPSSYSSQRLSLPIVMFATNIAPSLSSY